VHPAAAAVVGRPQRPQPMPSGMMLPPRRFASAISPIAERAEIRDATSVSGVVAGLPQRPQPLPSVMSPGLTPIGSRVELAVESQGLALPLCMKLCSCLWCFQGHQDGGRELEIITTGHGVVCGEDGYLVEHLGDCSQRVRCVKCHECSVSRWYLQSHMSYPEWWNEEHFHKTSTGKFWCVKCWAEGL